MRNLRLRDVWRCWLLVGLAAGGAGSAEGADWTLGGVPTTLIGVPAAAPIGTGECNGVRPGALVEIPTKGTCTLNFLFVGSADRYIGTAGHCVLGDSLLDREGGEMSWSASDPTAPVARARVGPGGSLQRIGTFAYAILQDPKDFALVRLDPGVASSPKMCHFGGPTGIRGGTPDDLILLHHWGNGLGLSLVAPGRTAFALGMPDPDHVFANGAAISGDSGSPVIDEDGEAIGVLVTVGAHVGGPTDAGVIGITRLAPQVERAGEMLGVTLTLQLAPVNP